MHISNNLHLGRKKEREQKKPQKKPNTHAKAPITTRQAKKSYN